MWIVAKVKTRNYRHRAVKFIKKYCPLKAINILSAQLKKESNSC